MQFTILAGLAAMAVGASAQAAVNPEVANSVLMVLATALPEAERSYALASSSAFAAEMASSLMAGETPGWYASLPADVKSILPELYPAAAQAEATTTPTPSTTSSAYSTVTPSATSSPSKAASISAYPTGSNGTVISTVRSATLSATGSATDSATAPSLPESTGAASQSRVAFGAGIAGVVGFLGMLAL